MGSRVIHDTAFGLITLSILDHQMSQDKVAPGHSVMKIDVANRTCCRCKNVCYRKIESKQ